MAMEGQLSRVTAISTSEAIRKEDVQSVVSDYKKLFDENQGGSVEVLQVDNSSANVQKGSKHKLELNPGMVALDMGCGIGGPGRVMARFSEAKIIGLNNNDYQLTRCKKLTTEQGLGHLCSYMKAGNCFNSFFLNRL